MLICLNETFLNKAVEDIDLEGYSLVGRRDRRDGQSGGGIAVFAKSEYINSVTLVKVSDTAERIWCLVHSDHGPVSLCAWYRPPMPGEVASIRSFEDEWEEQCATVVGTIAIGDMNVHAKQWLRWSAGESREGTALFRSCQKLCAQQVVREPTREQYLLDLVIANIDGVKAKVIPGISDHEIVICTVKLSMPETETVTRTVWQYRDGDWDRLRDTLVDTEWSFIGSTDTSDAARRITDIILEQAHECIPERRLDERKVSHPWLTAKAVVAVRTKHVARGSLDEKESNEECSRIMLCEHAAVVARARDKLQTLPRGSEQWWVLSKQLMHSKTSATSIPALKRPDGTWVMDSSGKADHFAEIFQNKCKMLEEEINPFTDIAVAPHEQQMLDCSPIPDLAAKALLALKADSATGSDLVSTRILKECAASLALPLALLLSRILETGVWPTIWMMHWICPLYKKKAVHDGGNYRGVRLTSQLSKVAERMLQQMYAPFIYASVAFGPNQFAYAAGRGTRDALALMVLTWLDGFERSLKFAVYCSDVSGAFDKVRRERLEAKLHAKGIHPSIVAVLSSWLRDRVAQVIVGGKRSAERVLKNMVYQGTVLGPGLWNLMYEDARWAIQACGFTEVVYADDLNSWRAFATRTCNAALLGEAECCQSQFHTWGKATQIQFDPAKESMHVVGRHDALGADFKILGVEFDCKLLMNGAVHETAVSARWKLKTVMRATRFPFTANCCPT